MEAIPQNTGPDVAILVSPHHFVSAEYDSEQWFFLVFLFFLSLRSSASENSPLEKRKAIVQISSVQRDNVLKSYIIWWWLFNLISADDDNRLHFFFSSMTNEIWSGMDYGTLLLLLHQQQTKHHVQHQHTKSETFVFFIFLNYAVIWRGRGWSC